MMGDVGGSGPEENDGSLYESIRSRPVTPSMMLRVNAGAKGRKLEQVVSPAVVDAKSLQIHSQPMTEAMAQGESYGLKILGCNAPGIDERPLSAVTRLGPVPVEQVNQFQTSTDAQGDIMEFSDNFQKLKISRNLHGPGGGGGGGDGPITMLPVANHSRGIMIQSLTSDAVVVVPETHRSNQDSRGQAASSDNEVPVYPTSIPKCKLSKRRRKRRTQFGSRPSSASMGLHSSLPDEAANGPREYCMVNGYDEDESGEAYDAFSSRPSTSKSTMFDEFEMMRPETASSEIIADGMLVSEEEQHVKELKSMFGIQDDDNWYLSADEAVNVHSRKYKLRLLTKLFYRRYETQSTKGLRYTHKLMLSGLHNRLEDFVLLSVPPGFNLKMRITRVKKGVAGKFFPLYYMHLERDTPGDRKCMILAAKKHKVFRRIGYTISTDPAELNTNSEYCVGRIDSNFVGTEFTLRSGRSICSHVPLDKGALMALPKAERFKEELTSIIYDPNVLGFRGPRKMKVILPKMKNLTERETIIPRVEEDSILPRYYSGDIEHLLRLKNKDPIWNKETHSYILNFAGRVNIASVKNFQIVSDENEEQVLLQFGRTSENTFSMDFQYPFSPLQAFAIALTSFDSKLACE